MIRFCCVLVLTSLCLSLRAFNQDTTTYKLSDEMLFFHYSEVEETHLIAHVKLEMDPAVTIDMCFRYNELMSIKYISDSCSFNAIDYDSLNGLYVANDYVGMIFPTFHGYQYNSSSIATDVCPHDQCQFLLEADTSINKINRLTQNFHDPKILGSIANFGILITFRKGVPNYLTIFNADQKSILMLFFKKSGKIKKFVTMDSGNNRNTFATYQTWKLHKNKLKQFKS